MIAVQEDIFLCFFCQFNHHRPVSGGIVRIDGNVSRISEESSTGRQDWKFLYTGWKTSIRRRISVFIRNGTHIVEKVGAVLYIVHIRYGAFGNVGHGVIKNGIPNLVSAGVGEKTIFTLHSHTSSIGKRRRGNIYRLALLDRVIKFHGFMTRWHFSLSTLYQEKNVERLFMLSQLLVCYINIASLLATFGIGRSK